MAAITAVAAVLATGLALALWARAVATRALGDGAGVPARRRAGAAIAATVLLQCAAATHAAGPSAGLVGVACGWMVGGALFTLALNRWPGATVAGAQAVGGAALVVCAVLWLL